jgi:hypothetical protein
MRVLHRRWQRWVSLHAAGALAAAEAARLDAHLAGCAGCRADLDAARRVVALLEHDPLREATPPLPLPALVTRVQARLDAMLDPRPSGWLAGRGVRGWAWGAAAAAALAVVAVFRGAVPTAPPAPSAPTPAAVVDAADQPSTEMLLRMERVVTRSQAARYLDEAGDVLVTVTAKGRRCDRQDQRLDVGDEAQRSRELLARRRLLLDVDAPAMASARPVLEDVEEMLREVAALEACARPRQLESIHREMERRRLLMKMDLMARELAG